MRIPYDAVVLAAVLEDLAPFVGGKVQRVVQPDASTVCIELYGGPEHGASNLLACCHADHYRLHLATRRYGHGGEAPAFCMALRARLDGCRLTSAEQIAGDRVARLEFSEGHVLVVELMGKHSNIVLVDAAGKVIAAAKSVNRAHSVRPVQAGQPYLPPPVLGAAPARSPFARKLIEAGGSVEGPVHPVLSPGNGAYPYSVAALGLPEIGRPTISIAIEQHYDEAIPAAAAEGLRASLAGELRRVLLARDVAIHDLQAAVDRGMHAGEEQRMGELLLAYGPAQPGPRAAIEAFDYDGRPVTIRTNPDLDFKANAETYFVRARKAKERLAFARDQLERLLRERDEIAANLRAVETAAALDDLATLRDRASQHRWLHVHHQALKAKDRPFEGHRVREVLGPGGVRVLYGETAEANDYLTLRVARSNDIWLHVRGGVSAHVVIVTNNQPDRIGPEALHFAAGVAVKQSPSKHAGIVAVDYTLKKHVRKSRGAPPGSALYTHEKTIHVGS